MTLHWVYVINAISRTKGNFASLLLRIIFRAYTGHANLVILLLVPDRLIRTFSKIPQMRHICEMLTALPQLKIDQRWSIHSLMQVPLSLVIYRPLSTELEINVSLRYTATDIFDWSDNTIVRRRRSPVRDRAINWILKKLADGRIHMIPTAQQYYLWSLTQTERPLEYHTIDDIPKLDHWIMPNGMHQSIKVSAWTTGNIRNYWRDKENIPIQPPNAFVK
jgi:hypothetical protein